MEESKDLTNGTWREEGGDFYLGLPSGKEVKVSKGGISRIVENVETIVRGISSKLGGIQETMEETLNKDREKILKELEVHREEIEFDKGKEYYSKAVKNLEGVDNGVEQPLFITFIVKDILGEYWEKDKRVLNSRSINYAKDISKAIEILTDKENPVSYIDEKAYYFMRLDGIDEWHEEYIKEKKEDFIQDVAENFQETETGELGEDFTKELLKDVVCAIGDTIVTCSIELTLIRGAYKITKVAYNICTKDKNGNEIVHTGKEYTVDEVKNKLRKELWTLVRKSRSGRGGVYVPKGMKKYITKENYLFYSSVIYYLNNILETCK